MTRPGCRPALQTAEQADARHRAIAKLAAHEAITTRVAHGVVIWGWRARPAADTIGHALQRAAAENA